MSHIRLSTVLS